MILPYLRQLKSVGYLTEESDSFSTLYLKVRECENRVLTDDQLKQLPYATTENPNWKEWKRRQKSALRFTNYLNRKNSTKHILDLGCGNGWFAHILAKTKPDATVVGIDINPDELEQAARVFNRHNLRFVYGDIFALNDVFSSQFDLITVNATIQYFGDMPKLKALLKSFLKPKGELHIIDSPIYSEKALGAAKQRTENYYRHLGFPEMAEYYYHHSLEELKEFKIRYRPKKSIFNKLIGFKDSPFPWLIYVNESSTNQ